ncbi:MAG: cobalt ECF transporter T component CbiQ [Pseudomonadota bacterium]
MAKIDSAFFDIGYLDTLSCSDSLIHRLDPRIKLLTTMVFIVTVVSFDKYEIAALIPFFIFPFIIISMANLPVTYLMKKLLIVSPFAIMIGIFNPFIDSEPMVQLAQISISGGWISFLSIMLRFCLTVIAGLVLISSTGFLSICLAAERLGVPRIFTNQMLFMYRYIFVLIDEAARMVRARSLRSFNGNGMGLKIYGYLISHLLLRTLDRAQRIHHAMLCRGFDGEIRIIKQLKIGVNEILFIFLFSSLFVAMRLFNIPHFVGKFITG